MGEVVQVSGQLVAGPSSAGEGGFPAGVTNLPFTLYPAERPYGVATGGMKRIIATSAGVYVTLDGVPGTVTKATFIYLRTIAPMLLRITRVQPAAADVVFVLPVSGLYVQEFDPTRYVTLLELSGSGTVEYFVSGAE